MKDPERLLASREATARERELLEAGAAEEPPRDGAARLALALGAEPLSSFGSPRAAETAAGTAKVTAELGATATSKWLALVTGAALMAGSAYYVYERRAEAPVHPQKGEPASKADAESVETGAETSEREAVRSASPATTEVDSQNAAPRSAARSPSIAEEIERLERARNALQRRDGHAAQRELDAYERAFARGTLREEADFLRIEALVASGAKERARSLGNAFLKTHSASVHAPRVRVLLGSLDER